MADVRIGEVTTDVTLSDPSDLLSPDVLDRIVTAVLARLDADQRERQAIDDERAMGRRR